MFYAGVELPHRVLGSESEYDCFHAEICEAADLFDEFIGGGVGLFAAVG